ncbi:MAG: glycosyltransferase family 4 protein [Candidatus Micrarchaeaceae archaeon]
MAYKIAQINSVILRGDAISNIMRATHDINISQGYQDTLIVDLFSEYDDVLTLAEYDYDKSPLISKLAYFFPRFMQLDNKIGWLKQYLVARRRYRPGIAKSIIENADVRIWHYGAFYTLFRQFHAKDILYYANITYPYLSNFSEFGMFSKNMLQATLDLEPFAIAQSNFTKRNLMSLGFPEDRIHILPLFHKYNLPYITRNPSTPRLLAWGRYAKNKAIPELVEACNQCKLHLRVFGDNNQLKEFREQYSEAVQKNTRGYAELSGKIMDFEAELNKANIYVCNSYHEGFNMPLIEAEAHSLPVLARRGTAMDELVKDGYNGFLFDDISEVPVLVDKIMRNYAAMSRNAWQHSQNYTFSKYKERYLRILEEYQAVK